MPVEDAVIVTILPDDGQRVGADCHNVRDARGLCVAEFRVEHIRIGFGFHVLMSAAAGGAWAGRAQQLERIDARVIVAPCDGEFSGLFIGCDAGWFFVHGSSFSPLLLGEGLGVRSGRWNIRQKIRCRPAGAGFVIGRDEIPPHIAIHRLRTVLHEEDLRVKAEEYKFAIQAGRGADS